MKAAKSGDRMAYSWIKMRPLLMLTVILVIFFSYGLAGKTTTM